MALWSNRTASLRQLLEELSWPAFVLLAFAVFFLFSTTGFLIDIMAGGRQPAGVLAATVIFSGCVALLYGYGGVGRKPAPIVLAIALHIAFYNLLPHMFTGATPLAVADAPARLRFDASATLTA